MLSKKKLFYIKLVSCIIVASIQADQPSVRERLQSCVGGVVRGAMPVAAGMIVAGSLIGQPTDNIFACAVAGGVLGAVADYKFLGGDKDPRVARKIGNAVPLMIAGASKAACVRLGIEEMRVELNNRKLIIVHRDQTSKESHVQQNSLENNMEVGPFVPMHEADYALFKDVILARKGQQFIEAFSNDHPSQTEASIKALAQHADSIEWIDRGVPAARIVIDERQLCVITGNIAREVYLEYEKQTHYKRSNDMNILGGSL